MQTQFFDTSFLTSVFISHQKVWYKDSLSIEEITLINFHTDTAGNVTKNSVILHYVFMDPRTHSFYYYKNFSDTATIVKKYAGADSFKTHGGWNFYVQKDIEYIGMPMLMSDTIIKNINYKRVRFNRIVRRTNRTYISIAYFRCDKKGSMFVLDKPYSEKIGCPMVRIDELPTDKKENPKSSEICFVSDTLSHEELKVFDAWERNARLNPVNK